MSEQQKLDLYREMNRYDDRHEDWPSSAVFEPPRRTLGSYWKKFHAARDCGARNVVFVENTTTYLASDDDGKYTFRLRCWECGHRVPEDEVLFVGGDWYSREGWTEFGRSLDDLYISPERVCELGPDPDEDELRQALRMERIEREAGPHIGGPLRPEQWRACEECDHEVPLLFDDRCRMCYDGPWTERLTKSLEAFELKVREWHNNSFVHRLGQKVDPLHPVGKASKGEMLWRRHDAEPTTKLVEVSQRFEDYDDGHMEYVLADPTHTQYSRYHEDDVADCFWSTGLYNEEPKPVMDDRIREVYQRVCDHSFNEVHDAETMEPAGEQCIHCRLKRDSEMA